MDKERVFKASEVAGFSLPGAEDTYISRMLIDSESVGSKKIGLNHGTLKPGKSGPWHKHPCPYEEVYYILRGQGLLTIDDETHQVGPGTVAYIPCEEYHKPENTGDTDLEFLTVWSLPIKEGANKLYDERKRLWGTSFKKVSDK